MRNTVRFVLLGGLAMGLSTPGDLWAQTGATPTPVTPGTTTMPRSDTTRPDARATGAARTDTDRQVVDAAQLEEGANSFTEGQARSRLEDAGFTAIEGLRKDERGFWRGQAMRAGQVGEVALDFRGRIASGNLAALGTAPGSRTGTTTGSTTGTRTDPSTTVPSSPTPSVTGARPDPARPDGTPGNPPSTAVGRAVDRMQGETPRADGTPGNPPGTAAGRAVDGTTGSNITGTNPSTTTPAPIPPATR